MTGPLDNDKHCEMLAANARVAADAMRDGFKTFVQMFSAIVGGSIALRLASSPEQQKLLTDIAPLATALVVFLGLVSVGLIADSFRSFLRHRTKLNTVSGNVVDLPDAQSGITIAIMVIVIVVCMVAFWCLNPIGLKA